MTQSLIPHVLQFLGRSYKRSWLGLLVVIGITAIASLLLYVASGALMRFLAPSEIRLLAHLGHKVPAAGLTGYTGMLVSGLSQVLPSLLALGAVTLLGAGHEEGRAGGFQVLGQAFRRLGSLAGGLGLMLLGLGGLLLLSLPLAAFGPLLTPLALAGILAWWLLPKRRGNRLRWLIMLTVPFGLLLYRLVRWSLWAPAMLLEGLGPRAALRRSSELTRGRWLRTAAVIVAAGLASAVLQALVALVAGVPQLGRGATGSPGSYLNLVATLATPTLTYLAMVALFLHLAAAGPAAPAAGGATPKRSRRWSLKPSRRLAPLLLLTVVLTNAGNLAGAPPAYAATNIYVTSLADSGPGTFRAAVATAVANWSTGPQIISFTPPGTVVLASTVDMRTPGAGDITVDGGGSTISGFTIIAGSENPAARFTFKNLTLTGVSSGAALAPGALTYLDRVTVANNSAGGVSFGAGTVSVTNSTFANNGSGYDIDMINGTLTVTYSSFLSSHGGVQSGNQPTTTLINNVFQGAASGDFNCHMVGAGFSAVNHNLSNDGSCGGPATLQTSTANEYLGSLAIHGGLTQNVNLLPFSPGIGAADTTTYACPATDQRGLTRTPSFCSVGAYQFSPATTTTITGPSGATPQGSAVPVTVTVAGVNETARPGGAVELFVAGVSQGAPTPLDGTGAATFSLTGLAPGSYTLTAHYTPVSYYGTLGFAASDAASVVVLVNRGAPTVAVVATPSAPAVGASVTLTATISATGPVPTGTVELFDGTTSLGVATVAASAGSITTSTLANGPHSITAVYSGDAQYATATSLALPLKIRIPSTTTLAAPVPPSSVYGNSIALSASVAGASGPVPTGSVSFTATPSGGFASIFSATVDSSGNAALSVSTLAPGTYSVTASYGGDDYHFSSTSSAQSFTITGASTSVTPGASPASLVVGQTLTLNAAVAATGTTAVPTGTVTFLDGASSLGSPATLDNSGNASLTIPAPGAGPHTITAQYSGGTGFAASSAALPLTIARASTAITVAAPSGSSVVGAPVTIVANATAVAPSAAIPSGQVTFYDNGTRTLGSAYLSGSGSATITVPLAGAGTHTITATLANTADFFGSTSAGAAFMVTQASTTVSVAAAPNPASFGQVVTVTVNVTGTAPSIGAPAGTVALTVGTAAPQNLPLDSAGRATVTLSGLAVGSYPITATWANTPDYATATATTTLVIVAAASSVVLTSDHNPSTVGGPLTFTATVTTAAAACPGGTVTFNGIGATVPLVGGIATYSPPWLGATSPAGLRLSASYSGDCRNASATSSELDQHVDKGMLPLQVSVSPRTIYYGDTITYTITSTGAPVVPAGTLHVLAVNGEAFPPFNGMPVNVSFFYNAQPSPTARQVSVTYSGDSNYLPSPAPVTANFFIQPLPTTLTLSTLPATTFFAAPLDLTATVTDIHHFAVPGVIVTFRDGTTVLGTAVTNGFGGATLTTTGLGVGARTVSASFDGTNQLSASPPATASITVQGQVTRVYVPTASTPWGQSAQVIALVQLAGTVTPVSGGTVTFSEGMTPLGSDTVGRTATGVASINIPAGSMATGSHTITAIYSGMLGVAGNSGTGALVVTRAATTVAVSNWAFLGNPVVGVPTALNVFTTTAVNPIGGTVTVSDQWGASCTVADFAGSCYLTPQYTGTWTLTAYYSGDANHAPSYSVPLTLTVNPAGTFISFTTFSADPWVQDENVTAGWTVTGAASGTVSVSDDSGGLSCVAQPVTGSCTGKITIPGVHTITATYNGDANHTGSTTTTTKTVLGCYDVRLFNQTRHLHPTMSPASNCHAGRYLEGTMLTLSVKPDQGWTTKMWSDLPANDSPLQVRVTADKNWTPVEAPICFTVRIYPASRLQPSTGPDIAGFVNAFPQGFATNPCDNAANTGVNRSDDSFTYRYWQGTKLDLEAIPFKDDIYGQRYLFDWWYGDVSGTNPKQTIVVDRQLDISARFIAKAPPCYPVTVRPVGGGKITLSATNCTGPAGPGYVPFTSVVASGVADSLFSSWVSLSGASDGEPGWTAVRTISYDRHFSEWTFKIPLHPANPPSGLVLVAQLDACFQLTAGHNLVPDPDGGRDHPGGAVVVDTAPNCPGIGGAYQANPGEDYRAYFKSGTVVSVHGQPARWHPTGANTSLLSVLGWDGATGTDSTATLTITKDSFVKARFGHQGDCVQFSAIGFPVGYGTVNVTTKPPDYCPPAQGQFAYFPKGSYVTVDASDPTGESDVSFTVGGNPVGGIRLESSSSIDLQVNGSGQLRTTFCRGLAPKVLITGVDGRQTLGDPTKFLALSPNSQPDCPNRPGEWQVGETVTVVAAGDSRAYKFTRWSGPASGTADTARVTLTANRLPVTLEYKTVCHSLTLDSGGDRGSVFVSPEPNCPGAPAGSNLYLGNTTVAAVAKPNSGYRYNGWTGYLAGRDAATTFTMDADRQAGPDFYKLDYRDTIKDYANQYVTGLSAAAKIASGVVARVALKVLTAKESPIAVLGDMSMGFNALSAALNKAGLGGKVADAFASAGDWTSRTQTMFTMGLDCAADAGWGSAGLTAPTATAGISAATGTRVLTAMGGGNPTAGVTTLGTAYIGFYMPEAVVLANLATKGPGATLQGLQQDGANAAATAGVLGAIGLSTADLLAPTFDTSSPNQQWTNYGNSFQSCINGKLDKIAG